MTKAEKRTENVKRYQASFYHLRGLHHREPTVIETLLYVMMVTSKNPTKMIKLLKQYEKTKAIKEL